LGKRIRKEDHALVSVVEKAQYLNLNNFDKRDRLKLIFLWLSAVRNAAVSISCVKENGNIWVRHSL